MTGSVNTGSMLIESRALRPVAARLVSYGRSAKMAQHATLYVLRVARGGRQWYVARRFSEFRALYATLKTALATPHAHSSPPHSTTKMCVQCRELARAFASLVFPSRFSGFGAAKQKVESQRMQQLNAFVQVLLETTQGLLATQDDDDCDDAFDDWQQAANDGEEREDRCDALRIVREFLLVPEHLVDDSASATTTAKKTPSLSQPSTSLASDATTDSEPHRPRMTSSGSLSSLTSTSGGATTTFRVQDLDVMFRPTSPLSTWADVEIEAVATKATSPLELELPLHQQLDELFLADYASPASDAVIHRQLHACEEDGDAVSRPTIQALRRAESLRMSRRL